MPRQKTRRISTSSNDLSSDEDYAKNKKNKKRMIMDKETERLLWSMQPRRVTRSMSRARSAVRREQPPSPAQPTKSKPPPTTSSKNFSERPVSRAPSTSNSVATNRPSVSRTPFNSGRKTPEAVHLQNSSHYNTSEDEILPFCTIKLPSYDAFMARNAAFKLDIHALQNDIDVIHNQIRKFADMCPKL